MALIKTALNRLFPKGRAWDFVLDSALFIEGLSLSLARAKAFLDGLKSEAIPGTATDTLTDWFELLALPVDKAQTIKEKRLSASVAFTATGSGAVDYLKDIVNREFPSVYIVEVDLYNYDIMGDVVTVRDFVRLQNLISRIFPLHLEPFFDVRITEVLDTAYTGISITGKAVCGKILEV